MPSLLQVDSGNLRQFTFSERDEVTATPEFEVRIGTFIGPAHQCLVRNILIKLVEYVDASSAIKIIGLFVELLFELGRASVDIHDLGSVFGGFIV